MTDITALPRPPETSLLKALRQTTTFRAILVQPWTYLTGAVLLAVLAASLLESTGSVWGVTTALTFWGAWAWGLVGGDPHTWTYFKEVAPAFNNPQVGFFTDAGTLIDVGLVFGALLATLLASQFKIKNIKSSRQVAAAIIGGLLMGFGARLSFGCNIGAMFSGVPSMSLHGWVFMLFIFIGAFVGSKLLVSVFIGESTAVAVAPSPAAAPVAASAPGKPGGGIRRIQRTRVEKKENVTQFPIGLALLLGLGMIAYYYVDIQKAPRLAVFWVIGIALGFTLQRARFCFTAAMRDPCLTGGTNLTKAVMVALALATVLVSALQLGSYIRTGNLEAALKIGLISPVGVHTAVGAFLFGIGAVISGGCASGTLMRVGEGFVQQWIVLPFFCIGGLIGAAAWPLWRDLLMVDMKGAVYLPNILGGFVPALAVQLTGLFAIWLLADWWSKRSNA
ncbi:YeeE/YedE thiosulfate transporter family protein [Rhodoplanes sp.]|uniref:YeeE/YedE thiosulfate transporter family protein n=1 Tax=Rhodoplanes sp. TaxID=1968906 RepID=UPI0025FA5BBE|nr:YeeE/YedE thiosulfate transporter family protein [Rhodoplanes sp.]